MRIENKFTQLIRILNLLYANYFPKIYSKQLINQRIGGFISIQGDYLARAFIRAETPLEIIRDDTADLHFKRFDWEKYRITSSLWTGNWTGFDRTIPFVEAFKMLNEDMGDNFKNEYWREECLPSRFGEIELPRLAAERAWYLLYRCYVHNYRRGTSGGERGLHKLLHFDSGEEVLNSSLNDLIKRTRYEMVWFFVQQNNMVVIEKRPNGGIYTTPENALVDKLCASEWEIANSLPESEFRNKYVTYRTPDALIGLLDVLLSLETAHYDLFAILQDYQVLRQGIWPWARDFELTEFFASLVNEVPLIFKSLVENSFPAICSLFSQERLEKCRLLLEINTQSSETFLRTRLAVLDSSSKKNTNETNLIFINQELLPGYDTSFSQISIEKKDLMYSGFISITTIEVHDLPLRELIFGLVKDDINSILGRLPFWRHIWG